MAVSATRIVPDGLGADRGPDQARAGPPSELLQAVLVERLGDPTARIADLRVEPVPTDGYSGNRL
jgi:hypothetical protein